MPATIPDDEPTVATAALLVLQVPLGVTSFKVVVAPTHTPSVPVIAAGNGFTVTEAVVRQAPIE